MDKEGPEEPRNGFEVSLQEGGQILAFWKALEAFESKADPDGNLFAHLILAMPHELSPEGRSRALDDLCMGIEALHLPFVASIHKPDEKGDDRNFHAHIMMSARPFRVEGPYAWSFEASKATEFNLPAGLRWLREEAAKAFNAELKRELVNVRYSGISQSRRGVAASTEVHHGPAFTARRRGYDTDERERERLLGEIARHLNAAAARAWQTGDKNRRIGVGDSYACCSHSGRLGGASGEIFRSAQTEGLINP